MTTEELLSTVEECGECEFAEPDMGNIPVGIFLLEIQDSDRDDEPPDHKWRLTADNFMVRKGRISDGGYRATAPTREALVEIVRKYIVPLYEVAMANLAAMIDGTNDSLYYWGPPDKKGKSLNPLERG